MILEFDETGLISAKNGNPLGDAHELIARGVLMRLGFRVGSVDLSSGASDLYLEVYHNHAKDPTITELIRVQVKTISDTSLKLIGGNRAGEDRVTKSSKSNDKVYKYTSSHIDLFLGIKKDSLDFYLLPSKFLKNYNTSVSINKIGVTKNNYQVLLNWNDDYMDTEIAPKLL